MPNMGIIGTLASGFAPETLTQRDRIVADGGVITDLAYMNRFIKTIKTLGLASSLKFAADANWGVKKDGGNAVSTLYDISGNNNDASQGTGANQPIWTAAVQNGKSGLVFDGSGHYFNTPTIDLSGINQTQIITVTKNNTTTGSQYIYLHGSNLTQPAFSGWFAKDNPGTGNIFRAGVTTLGNVGYSLRLHNSIVGTSMILRVDTHDMTLSSLESGIEVNGNADNIAYSPDYNSNNTSNFGNKTGYIGRDATASYYNGNIFFEAWFCILLSISQRQILEQLINNYYAIY